MGDEMARPRVGLMVSYAQNAEDVVLDRALAGVPQGFYVDIGAAHPVMDSVTKHFYDRGWSGVNVEPLAGEYAALVEARPRDVNLNVGVGRRRETRTFFEAVDTPGLSTFTRGYADLARTQSEVVEREFELIPLVEIFDAHVGERAIDFLKVDVEGLEPDVLGGNDWGRYRPRCIVVEGAVAAVKPILEEAGYHQTLWDAINSFWVSAEEADALAPALSQPAAIVLDRFIPWHLHFFARDAVENLLAQTLQSTSREALRALAGVYCLRPDLQVAFGGPGVLRARDLVRWAATTVGADDPSFATLARDSAAIQRLARADPPTPGRLERAVRRAVNRAFRAR